MIFLRLALRAGRVSASSSRFWYRLSLSVPVSHALASSQAMPQPLSSLLLGFALGGEPLVVVMIVRVRVVVVLLLVSGYEIALGGGRRLRALLHGVLEQHVHEQVHRLGLDYQGARRLL